MLIIQASNIHEGGGRVLLKDLLSELLSKSSSDTNIVEMPIVLFIDKRFNILADIQKATQNSIRIFEIAPSIISRLIAEFQIWFLAQKNPTAKILCFGNLPPLLPVKNKVILYFHTVLYFQEFFSINSNIRLRIKHSIERCWVKWGLRGVNEVLVQSNFVYDHFKKDFNFSKIRVFPFRSETHHQIIENQPQDKTADFVYLAAGTHHKNHQNLIKAWISLSKEQILPNLHLTIDERYEEILQLIKTAKENFGAQIVNHGTITHQEAMQLYAQSKAVIFPSLCESFGLPLLEAKKMNLPILASELDYVRDLVDPNESFDPSSERSIARAVKRFLKIDNEKNKIYSAAELVSYLERT